MILYAFIDLPLNATFCRESPRDILEEAYGPGVYKEFSAWRHASFGGREAEL